MCPRRADVRTHCPPETAPGTTSPGQTPKPGRAPALTARLEPRRARHHLGRRHIWVTNANNATVSKINPNGVAPGTPINYTTGAGPVGVVFDGTNIWVTNHGGNTVSKIIP